MSPSAKQVTVRPSSVAPSQSSSTPLQISVIGAMEQAPQDPSRHSSVPAAQAPSRLQGRESPAEQLQSSAGLAVPSQSSSTISASQSSRLPGFTEATESSQSVASSA